MLMENNIITSHSNAADPTFWKERTTVGKEEEEEKAAYGERNLFLKSN